MVIVVAVVAVLYALHRLALVAEARGLIFYRTRPPRVRSLGLLEELVNPSIEYMVEEQSALEIRADHAESGEPPEPGLDRHIDP